MILDCFHNVCERCIFQGRQILQCPECNEKTYIDRRRPVREKIEFNYHLTGILSYVECQLQYDVTFSQKPFKELSQKKNNEYECNECNKEYTNQKCIQCKVPLCKKCFQNIHKYGKILQKHILSTIAPEKSNLLLNEKFRNRCFKHKRYIDQYCYDCDEAICLICIPEAHVSHRTHQILKEVSVTAK